MLDSKSEFCCSSHVVGVSHHAKDAYICCPLAFSPLALPFAHLQHQPLPFTLPLPLPYPGHVPALTQPLAGPIPSPCAHHSPFSLFLILHLLAKQHSVQQQH